MWVVDLESQIVVQLVYIARDYSPMRGHQKARPFKKEKYIIITNTHTHTHKAISHTGCGDIIWRIWERNIAGWTLCKPCDHTRWVQLPQAVSVERTETESIQVIWVQEQIWCKSLCKHSQIFTASELRHSRWCSGSLPPQRRSAVINYSANEEKLRQERPCLRARLCICLPTLIYGLFFFYSSTSLDFTVFNLLISLNLQPAA